MKKKGILILSFVLLFVLSISFFVYKSTFSYSDENLVSVDKTKAELQKLIVRTAYAFYDKNDYIQYESGNMLGIDDTFMFRDFDVNPENINVNNQVNMDNVSFLYAVYMSAINYDLASLTEHVSDINRDVGFSYEDLNTIALNDKDLRNVFTGYTEHYISGEELSKAFIKDFESKLEAGDIVVYSENSKLMAFLYLDDNKFMYAKGIDYKPLYSDYLDKGTLYITDSIFTDNKLNSDVLYYSIIRPVNGLVDSDGNAKGIYLPENSLARKDDVYVSRYTDVATKDVSVGQKITYYIDIKNSTSKSVTVYEIVERIDNNMKFVADLSKTKGKFTEKTTENAAFIEWSKLSVEAGKTVTLSYEVEVLDSSVNQELSDKSTIKFIEDGYTMIFDNNYFDVKTVFNEYQGEKINNFVDELTKLNGGIEYNTDSSYQNDYKTDISKLSENNPIRLYSYSFIKFIYYNALGLDLGNNDGFIYPNTILNGLFQYNDDGSFSLIKNDDSIEVSSMVVFSKYGGKLLKADLDRTKMITMPHYSSKLSTYSYSYAEFLPGDIFCYWNKDASGELKAFSYMFVSSSYNKDNDSYSGKFIRYSGTGISILEGKAADELINSLYSNDLFVVLRPSKINYITVDSIEMDDIFVSVDKTQTISYVKKPINSTILSFKAVSSDEKVFKVVNDNQVKGVGSGTAKLSVEFTLGNGEVITKEVNVTVTNDDSIVNMNTGYDVYKEDKIIFTGFDSDIDTIMDNIKFNEDVKVIFLNDSDEEVSSVIDGPVNMQIKYNDTLVDTYKIISIYSETLKYDMNNEVDVIKYFDIGNTVNDVANFISINMNTDEYSIIVYDGKSSDNIVKINDAVLCTGDILEIKILDNIVLRYVISVSGDINGDGELLLSDLIRIRRHMVEYKNPNTNEIEVQSGANYFAMDINKSGDIKLTDIIALRKRLIENYE